MTAFEMFTLTDALTAFGLAIGSLSAIAAGYVKRIDSYLDGERESARHQTA